MTSPSALADRSEWKGKTVVIYDGDCPFCSRYVAYQRLNETLGNVMLVNARERPDLVRAFDEAGLSLDSGMALVMDGAVHHGADCMNRLALMSSRSGTFNRINAAIFRSPSISRLLYPLLRGARNLTLRVLGQGALKDGV